MSRRGEKFRDLFPEESPPATLSPEDRAGRVDRIEFGVGPPRVSVIVVRHYQTPGWWEKCHDSVAAQRGLSAWELVVVYNFDNAFSIGEAMNVGVEAAKAPWVMFLGDDDWLARDALARLLSRQQGMAARVVFMGGSLVDANGRPVGVGAGTFLIDRDLFLSMGGLRRLQRLSDEDLLQRLEEKYGKEIFAQEPRCLYYYRMHSDQTSAPIKERFGVYARLREMGAKL